MTIFYSAFYRTLVLGLVLLTLSNSVQAASRQPIKLTADEERGEEACAKLAYEFGFATKDLLESLASICNRATKATCLATRKVTGDELSPFRNIMICSGR